MIKAAEALGRADEAEQARRELAEFRDADPRNVALDKRLAAVLKGEPPPQNDSERIRLAERAAQKSLYAASAMLYATAFASNQKLADNRLAEPAYNAACAAALAGCGQGKDDPPPDDAARTKLRHQALDWLKAELVAWRQVALTAAPGNKEQVARTLQRWKEDSDLAGIRDENALAKLPEDERTAFQELWSQVDQLLAKVH